MANKQDGNGEVFRACVGIVLVFLFFRMLYVLWLKVKVGVRRVKRGVRRLLAFCLDAAFYVGMAVLALLVLLLLLDLLIMAARPVLRAWRRYRSYRLASLPRYETVLEGAAPSGPIDRALAPLVAAAIRERYPGARISRSEFPGLRADALKNLDRQDPTFLRGLIAEPLFAKAQLGDPTVNRFVERHGQRRQRRPMFLTARFIHIFFRRIGWTEENSWRRPDTDRLLCDPEAFAKLLGQVQMGGLRAIEKLLDDDQADTPSALPPAAPDRHPEAGEPVTVPENADVPGGPEAEELPLVSELVDTSHEDIAVDPVLLAIEAVTEISRLLTEDHEGWEDPAGLLDRLAATLDEVALLHPKPESLDALGQRIIEARRRLPGWQEWIDVQLAPDFDPDAWSPALVEAALEAEAAGDLSVASVCRRAARRYLRDDPVQLAPRAHSPREIHSPAVLVTGDKENSSTSVTTVIRPPILVDAEQLSAADRLF